MKVLLKHDVSKLGKAGQVKNVADGYARNYLIPQGMAVLATPGAMKQADVLARSEQLRQAKLASDASAVAEAIKQVTLTFSARVGEGGKPVRLDHHAAGRRRDSSACPALRSTSASLNCANRSGRWARTKWPCIWRPIWSRK